MQSFKIGKLSAREWGIKKMKGGEREREREKRERDWERERERERERDWKKNKGKDKLPICSEGVKISLHGEILYHWHLSMCF